jgi:hypothetical protein
MKTTFTSRRVKLSTLKPGQKFAFKTYLPVMEVEGENNDCQILVNSVSGETLKYNGSELVYRLLS